MVRVLSYLKIKCKFYHVTNVFRCLFALYQRTSRRNLWVATFGSQSLGFTRWWWVQNYCKIECLSYFPCEILIQDHNSVEKLEFSTWDYLMDPFLTNYGIEMDKAAPGDVWTSFLFDSQLTRHGFFRLQSCWWQSYVCQVNHVMTYD